MATEPRLSVLRPRRCTRWTSTPWRAGTSGSDEMPLREAATWTGWVSLKLIERFNRMAVENKTIRSLRHELPARDATQALPPDSPCDDAPAERRPGGLREGRA